MELASNKEVLEFISKFSKANEGHFYQVSEVDDFEAAKKCALVAVDEILNAWPHTYDLEKEYLKGGAAVSVIRNVRSNITYWQEFKQEIERL